MSSKTFFRNRMCVEALNFEIKLTGSRSAWFSKSGRTNISYSTPGTHGKTTPAGFHTGDPVRRRVSVISFI